MISHMPGPIRVKLSEIVEGSREMDLGQKKFQNVDIEKISFSQNLQPNTILSLNA